jgi:hypothetical protein
MQKSLALFELGCGLPLVALAFWPFSGFCKGRPYGSDCESWAIFGVNIFGPIGLAAIACCVCSLLFKARWPHYFLAVVAIVAVGRFLLYGILL